MSDLFCPATLILARHGEAEYEADTSSSEGGSLTRLGRQQAAGLAERLRSRRISHIYSSTLACAVQTAEIAAATLDLDVTTRIGLRDSLANAIEEISDLHRGETVLVIAHQDIIQRGLPRIGPVGGHVEQWSGAHTSTIEIQVDADGMVCTAWDQAE